MATNQNLVQYGTAGGTAIYVDHSWLNHGLAFKKVTLSANYVTLRPAGAPTRPGYTGAAVLDSPQTILSGKTIQLHAAEADALVTAGKASYA